MQYSELKKLGLKLSQWRGVAPGRKRKFAPADMFHVVEIPLPKWLGLGKERMAARVHPAELIRLFQAAAVWYLAQKDNIHPANKMRAEKDLRGVMAGLREHGRKTKKS